MAGRGEDADRFHRALRDTLPERSRITLGYALICSLNGRFDRSRELLKGLEAADPSFLLEEALLSTGRHLMSLSKFEKASEVFEYAREGFPGSYRAHYYLAVILERGGDGDRAREECRRAVDLNPNFRRAAVLLEQLSKPK